jgi:ABC-2 type transport system ATP-binding protein
MFGLIGPDGAGKTTAIRLMCGLLHPDRGDIHVLGYDPVRQHRLLTEKVGYLSQRFSLYGDLTVDENVAFFAEIHGVRKYQAARDRLLEMTQLASFRSRRADRLSGGMKQKLGLACALLSRPRVLLLDEPSVGVDPASRRELWSIVAAMLDEARTERPEEPMTVIWATAYLDEAARCGRVLLLHQGRLLADAPPDEFLEPLRGRVFRLDVPAGRRRAVARTAARNPAVLDAQVAGDALRVVLRDGTHAPDPGVLGGTALTPLPPRFEDGFIDRLTGSHPRAAPAQPSAPPRISRQRQCDRGARIDSPVRRIHRC